MQLTRDQWSTLVTTAAINVFTGIIISIQAPFYPAEAQKKGASATEYGLVFGAYELTCFIVSPFIGKLAERCGVRILTIVGTFIGSVSTILFGLLDNIEDRVSFIAYSIILRIVEGIGTATAVVSSFSLIGLAFPHDVATMFATVETFYGFGFIIGPSIGGFLYSFGGFSFPFVAVGMLGLVLIFFMVLFLPSISGFSEKKEEHKVISALKVPAITMNLIASTMFAATIGFYSALLEPHLRQFHLPPQISSLFFVIIGLTYGIVSPVLGSLLDRGAEPRTLSIIGCILVIWGFTMVGPVPFLKFHASIPSVIFALLLHGCAYAAFGVASCTDLFKSAKEAGFSITVGMYGLIFGLLNSSNSLGGFIGPTIAGILYDIGGFRWATQFVVGSFIILLIVMIVFTVVAKRRKCELDEYEGSNVGEDTPILTLGNHVSRLPKNDYEDF